VAFNAADDESRSVPIVDENSMPIRKPILVSEDQDTTHE